MISENKAQVLGQSLSERKRTKSVRLAAWQVVRETKLGRAPEDASRSCGFMPGEILIKGTVPSMTFCIVRLFFCSYLKVTCLNFTCVQTQYLSELHLLHRPIDTGYMVVDEIIQFFISDLFI